MSGIDNIPDEGPLIVVKNHPCHCDFVLLELIFNARPDVRVVAKDSAITRAMPQDNTILIHKNKHRANPEDVQTLQQYLRDDGSFLATPWGSMNHQADGYATPERAANNAIRYASFARAALLPVYIEADWAEAKGLPLIAARVKIQQPIRVTKMANWMKIALDP